MKNRINFLHDELFLFLENLKDSKNEVFKDLKYTFRKDNFSNKLENGFWFLGDENNLIISFWKGENIYTKKPNICLNFELDKELIYLEITIEKANYNLFGSSENKFRLIHDYLLPHFGEFETLEEKDFLVYRHRLGPVEFWNDILVNFLIGSKTKIDEVINNFYKQFENEDEQSRYSIGQIDKVQFRRNLLKIKQYRDQLTELNEYENASYYNRERPFYLNSFQINDYVHINHMSINNIPRDNRWIFITGENGSGKTSLLKALAVFLGQGTILSNHLRNHSKTPIFNANLIGGKGEEKKISRVGNDLESRNAKRSLLRGFAAYGIHRTDIKSNYYLPKRNHELSKNGFLESILSDGITPLIDFNKTIEEWSDSKNSLEKFFHRREFFVKALLRTVPGLVDIHFTNSRKGLTSDFFIRFDDGPVSRVSYEQLSSGTKSILSFVADIIVRFYKQQPEAYDPSEFRGIVIVDEIDLHLHPQGQRNIILALSEVFPNIQFIVSTHSPIPLIGAPVNSVFCVVTRNALDGNNIVRLKKLEKEIKYLTPNTILTSDIFAFDFFNEMSTEKFDALYLEDNYDEIIKNKEIDERLSKLSNDFLPENLF